MLCINTRLYWANGTDRSRRLQWRCRSHRTNRRNRHPGTGRPHRSRRIKRSEWGNRTNGTDGRHRCYRRDRSYGRYRHRGRN